MLATAITHRFEELLENEVGGNVIIFAAGMGGTLEKVETTLDGLEGVKSYAALGTFETQLVTTTDVSADETLTYADLEQRVRDELEEEYWVDNLQWRLSGIDAREIGPNLPDVEFYAGRQLDARDIGPWEQEAGNYPPIVISADEAVIAAGLEVGDLLTFEVGTTEANRQEAQTVTFEIVGMVDRRGANVSVNFGAQNYTPKRALDDLGFQPDMVNAVVDIEESHVRDLRRALSDTPGVFVLETKMLNDLIRRMIEQFTSFPILVAGLSLVVGGIVIANSVALSTMERRREIAIMKAVGLQRERVLGMLLLEYGLMGLIGGLIGVGLGGVILLMLLIQAFGGELGESIPYLTALQLMGLCVLIALVAAIVTAWGASGEKPLNVLRYE
jgi:ABC-type antimicrobial peptide transport system permease subunit